MGRRRRDLSFVSRGGCHYSIGPPLRHVTWSEDKQLFSTSDRRDPPSRGATSAERRNYFTAPAREGWFVTREKNSDQFYPRASPRQPFNKATFKFHLKCRTCNPPMRRILAGKGRYVQTGKRKNKNLEVANYIATPTKRLFHRRTQTMIKTKNWSDASIIKDHDCIKHQAQGI